MRCAVQNSKLWVCIMGSLSVFLLKQSSRLTALSDSRALPTKPGSVHRRVLADQVRFRIYASFVKFHSCTFTVL